MTEPQDSTQQLDSIAGAHSERVWAERVATMRYVVHFATGQEVTRTASSWASLAEEYEGRGFRPGDFLIVPVDEPLTDEQVDDADFEQAAAAERAGERALDAMPSEEGYWSDEMTARLAHAQYLGADAALTSVVNHYTMSESDARSILDDIDPEVMDRYPEPNLSGEWADDPTPYSLAVDILGEDGLARHEDGEVEARLADAWEEGRDAVWGDALQATALRVLGEVDNALRVEAGLEAIVARYRTAAGLS